MRASPSSRAPRSCRDQRIAWIAFGLGLLSWTAGDVYWTLAFSDVNRVPYPSAADVGYLAALPCFYVGIALLIKRRIGHFTPASWLDGAIGGLAAASIGTAVLAPALVGLTKGDPAAVLTNLAYPLGDILLIGFIVGALVVSGAPGGQGVPGDRRRADRLDARRRDLPLPGGDLRLCRGLARRGVAGRRPADGGRRGAVLHPSVGAAARLQLADRLPLDLRRGRGRRPRLGPLQPPARGLDLALRRHARRGDPPHGDQLPREHRPDGGPARRRGHRLAHRARQPPQADPRPGVGPRGARRLGRMATSSPSTTWTDSSPTTTATATPQATSCFAGWAPTWSRQSSPVALPTAWAVTSSASSPGRTAGESGRSSRPAEPLSRSRVRDFASAPRRAPFCFRPRRRWPARPCGSPTAACTRRRAFAPAASNARPTSC